VAVFVAEVGDVRLGGFEDPQSEQAEHGYEREVVAVGRVAGGGEQGFELQVGQPEGRGLGGDGGPADVLGWGVFQDTVDDAGAVEPGHHRHPARDGGRLEPADFLHPPHVQLHVHPARRQRRQIAFGAPG